jgi:hypothetical protein
MLDQEATKKALEKFRRNVVKQARQNAQKKSSTGNLAKSITSKLNIHKQSFSLEFLMEDYASYVDKGVKGVKSSSKGNRQQQSPYKFGTGSSKVGKSKGGMSGIMAKWAKQKGLQWRDKETGKFMSHKSMGYLIARSVYNKGLKPSLFFTKPFEKEFKKLPDVLATAYGLDVEEFVDDVIKENFK